MARDYRSPEFSVCPPDVFFQGILTEDPRLCGTPPAPPAKPVYARPAVFGLRCSVKGDLTAGSLTKIAQGGQWHHVVFHGVVAAVIWLNLHYTRHWPEFIEIERLTVDQVAHLDGMHFPEDVSQEGA